MKKFIIGVMVIAMLFSLGGCSQETEIQATEAPQEEIAEVEETAEEVEDKITEEEYKLIDLYEGAMKRAYLKENGGGGFVAIELDSLTGLGEDAKIELMSRFEKMADNVYSFNEVKSNKELFKFHEGGNLMSTINGTVLSVNVRKYKNNKADIVACSWFGNLGAVFPSFKATYKKGVWEYELQSMAVS